MAFKKKNIPWNKGKTGIYSEKTKELWSTARKGRKIPKEQMQKILTSRKITNQKKSKELWNRECYNDPSHKPFINKGSGNPTWFKHPDIDGEFLCGNCHYHAKKKLKFSSKEERYKKQSKFMKENNPMDNKESRKKLSKTKTGKPLGPVHTEKFKNEQRLRWTGEGNPSFGGLSDKRRKLLSKKKKEVINNINISGSMDLKYILNPNYSIHLKGKDIFLSSAYKIF